LIFWITTLLFFFAPLILAGDLNREIDLRGEWLFEIGDNLEFADPNYNDSRWVTVNVPDAWENEGFPGFNGYGWYRTSFIVPKTIKNKIIILKLGQIDDVDRVYFNGRLLGGYGDFPPAYQTAFDQNRIYQIPSSFINFGRKNTLAVRVYDHQGGGGIVHGEVGIYTQNRRLTLDVDLSGFWKFKTGDSMDWATADFDDKTWKSIAVPCTWEQQGYARHDGYAWYRKKVKISKSLAKSKPVLLLGKINDVDCIYFNGAVLGETGKFPKGDNDKPESARDVEREFFIPSFLIQSSQDNVIAVRVYDAGNNGGIYSGYIGIASRENYLKYSRRKR
jgi:sialate O-acetylesterase